MPRLVKQFGRYLGRLRAERKWSLRELSMRSGIPFTTLFAIEHGLLAADIRQQVLLAKAYGGTFEWLMQSFFAYLLEYGAKRKQEVANA